NIALVANEGVGALVERLVPKLLSKNASSDVVDFVRSVAAAQPAAAVQAALAAMRDRADTTPLLARIDVPAAIVVGEEDGITPLADARSMSALLPRAEVEIVPGAGHLANLESPA